LEVKVDIDKKIRLIHKMKEIEKKGGDGSSMFRSLPREARAVRI
jgi:hypothetical protein